MTQKYETPYLNFFLTDPDDVICSSIDDGFTEDPWKDEW